MIRFDCGNTDAHLEGSDQRALRDRGLEALGAIIARRGPGNDMLGWLDLPNAPEGELRRIEDAAKRIQDENDCLVVIGIGGSYIGARAAIEALQYEARFQGRPQNPRSPSVF